MASSRDNLDGTPDVLKGACPVWGWGKDGDNIKTLPTTNGWQWTVDEQEVNDAREEVEEIQLEIKQKEEEARIDEQIAALEDLKQSYRDAMDDIGKDLDDHEDDLDDMVANEQDGLNIAGNANIQFTTVVGTQTPIIGSYLYQQQTQITSLASSWESAASRIEAAAARIVAAAARAAAARAEMSSGGGGSKYNPDTGRAGGIEMGAVDFTGPLMVHGTPENPEYVLTSKQMSHFVRNMSRAYLPVDMQRSKEQGGDGVNFNNCSFTLPSVKEPDNFIPALKQLAKQNRK